MKFLIGSLILLGLSNITYAADTAAPSGNTEDSTTKVQSTDDYYDGGNIDQPPQIDPAKARSPASGDGLPYSDDEIQKNTPENFAPKNMPIDQD